MQLFDYFSACLGATYLHGENGSSWAVEERGDALWVLFEKSNGVEDWLNNLHFHAVPYREMNPVWQCHSGFLQVWKSVKPHLEAVIRQAVKQRKKITVIGYSHGAALAVLCMEWIWYHFPSCRMTLSGFGFGCPRVLYGCVPPDLAQRWARFYVVRNLDDAVTHLPPRIMGYCHVGNLINVGSDGKYAPLEAHRPEAYLAEL